MAEARARARDTISLSYADMNFERIGLAEGFPGDDEWLVTIVRTDKVAFTMGTSDLENFVAAANAILRLSGKKSS